MVSDWDTVQGYQTKVTGVSAWGISRAISQGYHTQGIRPKESD